MAARASRGRVPYSVLNSLSSVDVLYDEVKKRKRARTIGVFEAERLVARRWDKEGDMYLVKWKGYSCFDNTWEPEEHISPASLRYFEKPNPPLEIVEQCVDRLRQIVLENLRHKGPEQRLTLEFRHDVFKFLFHGMGKAAEQKQWTLYEERDFSRCKLPENWNSLLDNHGDGVRMRFPVKMRTFLAKSPKDHKKEGGNIVEIPRSFSEKLSLTFIKIPSS